MMSLTGITGEQALPIALQLVCGRIWSNYPPSVNTWPLSTCCRRYFVQQLLSHNLVYMYQFLTTQNIHSIYKTQIVHYQNPSYKLVQILVLRESYINRVSPVPNILLWLLTTTVNMVAEHAGALAVQQTMALQHLPGKVPTKFLQLPLDRIRISRRSDSYRTCRFPLEAFLIIQMYEMAAHSLRQSSCSFCIIPCVRFYNNGAATHKVSLW